MGGCRAGERGDGWVGRRGGASKVDGAVQDREGTGVPVQLVQRQLRRAKGEQS